MFLGFTIVIRRRIGLGVVAQAVIQALWEAEAGGSQGQDIETTLVNMVKPSLLKIQKLARHGGVHQ